MENDDWQPIHTAPTRPIDKDGNGPRIMLCNARGESFVGYWHQEPDVAVKGWWVSPEIVPSFVKSPQGWKPIPKGEKICP